MHHFRIHPSNFENQVVTLSVVEFDQKIEEGKPAFSDEGNKHPMFDPSVIPVFPLSIEFREILESGNWLERGSR